MELFRLSSMNATKEQMGTMYEAIMKEFNQLTSHKYKSKVSLMIQPTELYCSGMMPQFQLKRDGKSVYNRASLGIAEYVINEIERPLLRRMIRRRHKQYDREEITVIEQYCIDLLDCLHLGSEGKDAREHRKRKLAEAFEAYLSKHTMLNIEGFIQFRLPSYKNDLYDIIDYAVDEYVMDKQYQEFITLLQYFVHVQDAKVAEVHIIHKEGNDFIILDERLDPVEKRKSEGFVMEMVDREVNYEDMIISTLISISPQQVWIHTKGKDQQIIKTIQHIFEDRTVLCESCSICHNVLDKYSLDQ